MQMSVHIFCEKFFDKIKNRQFTRQLSLKSAKLIRADESATIYNVLNEKPNPPAVLGRLEEDVSGVL